MEKLKLVFRAQLACQELIEYQPYLFLEQITMLVNTLKLTQRQLPLLVKLVQTHVEFVVNKNTVWNCMYSR
jgi:hypothetical protein